MTNILKVFATIKGISAASGLFLNGKMLYIIGDNSSYLYAYHLENKNLEKISLLGNLLSQSEHLPKAQKPDFEAICFYDNVLYIIGSGSTAVRNRMIEYHLDTKKLIERDLSSMYAAMKKAHAIDNEDLNIEGAIFTGNKWILANRGNGRAIKNGIFIIEGSDLTKAKSADFIPISLIKIDQTSVAFTDMVLHKNRIYFVATAEDTTSTYNDGKILGSYIGSLDANTLKLNFIEKIAAHQKFEGITFFREQGKQLAFLICEDADTDSSETRIYQLLI